jgi:hypothetical protein
MIRQIDLMGLHLLIDARRNSIYYRAAVSLSLELCGSGYADNTCLLDGESNGDTLI